MNAHTNLKKKRGPLADFPASFPPVSLSTSTSTPSRRGKGDARCRKATAFKKLLLRRDRGLPPGTRPLFIYIRATNVLAIGMLLFALGIALGYFWCYAAVGG